MKIGTLISTILMIIGTAMQFIIFNAQVFSGNSNAVGLTNLVSSTEIQNGSIFYWGTMIVFWFALIFFFITQMTTKKLFLILASIFGFIGVAGQALGVLTSTNYWTENGLYILGGFVLAFVGLLMFIGCIQYRQHNKLAIITSLLVFLVLLGHNVFFGFIYRYGIGTASATAMLAHLYTLLAQSGILVIHGLIFSFSKKDIFADDGAEDLMSVETGDAFASYVPSKKKKKSKDTGGKKKSKDAYSFDF